MTNNDDGRRIAKRTLTLTLALSVAGNVTHAVMTESPVALTFRVIGAAVWPLLTFFAIEVLVRMVWHRRFTHGLARFMLIWPAVPAAITSYEHQASLLLMMGERPFIAWIGPGAIDGLMIGCTLALLFTRVALPTLPLTASAPLLVSTTVENLVDNAVESETSPAVSLPIAPERENGETRHYERKTRAGNEALEKAVLAVVVDGESVKDAALTHGVGASTLARYAKVARILRDNTSASIDAKELKVRPELVDLIREHARRTAVR